MDISDLADYASGSGYQASSHETVAGGTPYELQVVINSTAISDFSFSEESRQISFRMEGSEGIMDSTSLRVGTVLEGLYMVTLDGNVVEDGIIIISDETTSQTIIAIQHLHTQRARGCNHRHHGRAGISCPAGRRADGSDRPRCGHGKNKVQPLNQDTFNSFSKSAGMMSRG
jgi:hypothetical protein